MKFDGVLFFAGLICAASAKLPTANRKYKFYFNRFFATLFLMVVMGYFCSGELPTSIQTIRIACENEKRINSQYLFLISELI
jgi:hypothetical protein